jgi:hypothetical protein
MHHSSPLIHDIGQLNFFFFRIQIKPAIKRYDNTWSSITSLVLPQLSSTVNMSSFEQTTRKEAILERFYTNKKVTTTCSVCHFAARQEAVVAQHFRYVHDKVREQNCNVCNYYTVWKEDLEYHINLEHDNFRNRATNALIVIMQHHINTDWCDMWKLCMTRSRTASALSVNMHHN